MDGTNLEEGQAESRGFSRRTMLKAGAIVGTTLWVAPVVESFTSPASATSYAHGCVICYYYDTSKSAYVILGGGLDDPTVANGEAETICKGVAGTYTKSTSVPQLPTHTSGPFLLFNANPDLFSIAIVNGSKHCEFNNIDVTPTNPVCPPAYPNAGGLPDGVACYQGTWTS